MGLRRIAADLREVQTNLTELLSQDTAEEKAASRQLADSARRFSRQTRAVVDDKLTFSATLMRAGEVGAATRLLKEVEEEVRSEEAALIEVVNEVKVASSIRRERITRLRLARTLIAALLGISMLAFSAVGMAVAGVFRSREERVSFAPYEGGLRGGRALRVADAAASQLRHVRIADVNLLVTASQFRKIIKLKDGSVDAESFGDLMSLLPDALAQKIQDAIDTANETVAVAEETVAKVVDVQEVHKTAEKESDEAAEDTETASADDAGDDQQSAGDDGRAGSKGDGEKDPSSEDEEDGDSQVPPPPQHVPPIRP
jgi:hypothetical protein